MAASGALRAGRGGPAQGSRRSAGGWREPRPAAPRCAAPSPRSAAAAAAAAAQRCARRSGRGVAVAPAVAQAGRPSAASSSAAAPAAPVPGAGLGGTPPPAPLPWNPLGFTPRNELLAGRVASLGLVAGLLGERFTGKGALAQLVSETRLPRDEVELLFCVFVLLLAKTALVPGDGAFLDAATSPCALGVRWGDAQQRALGRLSMAAFASALLAERLTGLGPLALLQVDAGALGDELTAGCVFLAFLVGLGSDERGDGGGVGAAALLVDDTLVEWDREDAEAEED